MITKTQLFQRFGSLASQELAGLNICELIPVYSTQEAKGHRIYSSAEEAEASFKTTHPASITIIDDVSQEKTDKEILGFFIKKVN